MRSRVHSRRLWPLLALAATFLAATAAVYASVPHVFSTGEILDASGLNGVFSALDQRISALEAGAPRHWDGFLESGGVIDKQNMVGGSFASATVAHFSITPPATGSLVVRVHLQWAVRNNFDTSMADCGGALQLSTSMQAPPSSPIPAGTIGISLLGVAGNLPTQFGAGAYEGFPQSVERAFAVTGGQPITLYLNARTDCRAVVYNSISAHADFFPNSGTFSVVAN